MENLKAINVKNKLVFLRLDLNVVRNESGQITDARRIVEALPTINYLLENNARLIVCSHLGRPKGFDNKDSLYGVFLYMQKALDKYNIIYVDDVVGEKVDKAKKDLKSGEILLLENVRFYPEESKGDAQFAKRLAEGIDVYVSDAFGTLHRAHSSTATIAQFVSVKCPGFLVEKEVNVLNQLLNGNKGLTVILGGSKVSDKIGVINNLMEKAKTILIGGAMALTFLKAQGFNVGSSKVESDKLEEALQIINAAKQKSVKIVLPVDFTCAREISAKAKDKTFTVSEGIPEDYMGLDIGRESIRLFVKYISASTGMIFWNGPLGVFEVKPFSAGTKEVSKALAKINSKGVKVIVGGGDSAAAVAQFKLDNKFYHISTGGGASLEYLEGKALPGVEALK